MLTSIRDYFESKIGAPPASIASNRPNRSAELAAAALLLEVIRSDANIDAVEQQAAGLGRGRQHGGPQPEGQMPDS